MVLVPKCEDLMLVSVLNYGKLNIFEFLTVHHTKKVIEDWALGNYNIHFHLFCRQNN